MAVGKLAEAAHNPRNHRYSASRGIPKLRSAITDLYKRKFDVELDPETEVVTTIGAKEGFSHLMWVLVGPGDTALVPSPSYPIHIWGPLFAGADVRQVPLQRARRRVRSDAPDPGEAFFDGLMHAWEESWPKPRVIVLSFPHNPTTACVDLSFMERLVAFAREHEVVLVHDFAYADLGFDGYEPPSILQVPGAKDVAVELYTMTKSFSMAGWRVGFVVGNREIVQALTKLKTYLDYGTFQPIQIAAIVAMNEAPDYPKEINADLPVAPRRPLRRAQPDRLAPGAAQGDDVRLGPIPEPYREMGSLEFSKYLISEADVATSPGVGLRSRRGRPRALRPHRERAAHRPGRAQPACRADEAGVDRAAGVAAGVQRHRLVLRLSQGGSVRIRPWRRRLPARRPRRDRSTPAPTAACRRIGGRARRLPRPVRLVPRDRLLCGGAAALAAVEHRSREHDGVGLRHAAALQPHGLLLPHRLRPDLRRDPPAPAGRPRSGAGATSRSASRSWSGPGSTGSSP